MFALIRRGAALIIEAIDVIDGKLDIGSVNGKLVCCHKEREFLVKVAKRQAAELTGVDFDGE